LVSTGEVKITPETVGYRSAFIGAVLATLPGANVTLDPLRVRLPEPAKGRGEVAVGQADRD
jgi:hypothetical protein